MLWVRDAPRLEVGINEDGSVVSPATAAIAAEITTFRESLRFANVDGNGVSSDPANVPSEGGEAHGQGAPVDDLPPAKPPSQTEVTPMPELLRNDVRALDIPIPLISGAQATLRIPIPLSEADYELLTALIDTNLKHMKRAIVRQEQAPANEEQA